MAKRKKRRGKSLSAYFRGVFQERPHWLHETSNDLLLARYREDRGIPAEKVLAPSVRNTLANIKSKLRKEERENADPAKPRAADKPAMSRADDSANSLLANLEEQIDDCLTLAKNLDREGLDQVINLLRRARNGVVWKIGQP